MIFTFKIIRSDFEMDSVSKPQILAKIMKEFIFMWILTGVGMFLGSMLPQGVALLMSILAIVLLIVAIFVKKNKVVNKIFYAVPFLMGFAFFYSVNHYLGKLGPEMVLGVLAITVIMFAGLGVMGYVVIKKDLGFLGKFLLFALIILIVVSIIGIFFSSHMLQLLLAVGGIVIFSLYTLYDFNRIQHDDIKKDETTGYALSLYLDFINLFLDILRLVSLITR